MWGGDRFLPMCASAKEVHCFLRHTLDSSFYLEFGCGGSTFLMLYTTFAHIFSVESDKKFINKISYNNIIKQGLQEGRLDFHHIDIGKTGAWGYPVNDSKKQNYPLYSQQIFNTMPQNIIDSIDTIFIDGRFRVACTLNSILYCNKNCKILIHDFFNREHYHIVLEFLDVIERAETLGVFAIKNNIDISRIKNLIEKYQFITF